MKQAVTLPARILWNAFFWTYDRATWQYDVMVIAILAFIWLTPPTGSGTRWRREAVRSRGLWIWCVEIAHGQC